MTYKNATLRPAMTALAAVLAFSSTSSLAQSVDEPAVTTTPAIEVNPTPVAAEPVALAPSETAVEPTAAADPLAPKATVPSTRAATAATRARPASAQADSTRASAQSPVLESASPAPLSATEQPLPAPLEAAPAPLAAEEPAAAESPMNDMLPAAGIGAAALLLLTGAGVALRRRRRTAESDDLAWQDDVDAVPAEPAKMAETPYEPVLRQPALVAAPAPVADSAPPVAGLTPVEGPTTALPESFDLSRFGFNVQEAYKGPTEDNPSLSLKHRLRRASGMDQQERKLDAEVEAVTGESVLDASDPNSVAEAPAAKPVVAEPAEGEFILARARKPAMRPLHTHSG